MSRSTPRISSLLKTAALKRAAVAAVLALLLAAPSSVQAAQSGVAASEAFECKFQTAGRSFDLTPVRSVTSAWTHLEAIAMRKPGADAVVSCGAAGT